MRSSVFFVFFSVIVSLFFCGARYHPHPLSPLQSAIRFEERRLDSIELKKYMEKALHKDLSPWPPKEWDLTMLTLAADYFHPDLAVARAQWNITKAAETTAAARLNPNFNIYPQIITNPSGVAAPWLLNIISGFPIEFGNRRRHRTDQAKHLSESAYWKVAGAAWQVRSRLRTNLISYTLSKQKESLLAEQVSIQEAIARLVEKRIAEGEAAQPDILQNRLALEKTRFMQQDLKRQSDDFLNQLANAIGVPVNTIQNQDLFFRLPENGLPALHLSREALRREALMNRPDLLSLLAEYEASQAGLQVEISRQYPSMSLGPGYQFDSGQSRINISVPTIVLPILNQNQGPIAEAEARREEVAARFMALQDKVIADVDRAWAAYENSIQSYQANEALVKAQQTGAQSIQSLFNSGEIDRLAELTARNDVVTTKVSQVDATLTVQQALGLLEDAIQHPLEQAYDSSTAVPAKSIHTEVRIQKHKQRGDSGEK